MLKLPYPMRRRYCASFTSLLVLFFLLSACRNEPTLPVVSEDTEVSVRLSGDPTGLNYLLNYDAKATLIMRLMSLPLLDFDAITYKLEPVLAKSLPSLEEVAAGPNKGLVAYKYEILEEAVWDDGSPITGKDFEFTLKAIHNPNYRSPYPSYFAFVKGVDVNKENPKQFTVYANKNFIANATIGNFTVMPAHTLDPSDIYSNYTLDDLRNKENKEKIASDGQLKQVATLFTSPKNMGQEGELGGSGAYKLVSWEAGQSLTLVKKENWWGNKIKRKSLAANPKKLIFKIVPDFNAARSLFRNGELDIMSNIGIGDFENLKEDDFFKENYNFQAPSMFAHRMILINNSDPKFQDKRVRRALAHLLNLEEVFNTVYMGEKKEVTTIIHPSKPYYNHNLKPIEFNVEKAKSLLTEAGWTDSNNNGTLDQVIDGQLQELEIKFSFSGKFNDYRNIGQIFQEEAKKAGVNIQLNPLDSRPLQLGWKQKDYDLSVRPSIWLPIHRNLKQSWHSQSPSNYASFGQVETDTIIDEIAETVDEDRLAELYMRFQEIMYDEQPVIFINTASDHIMVSKKFGEVTTSAVPPRYFLNELKEVTVPINVSNN